MAMYYFVLFHAGAGENTQRAQANLQHFCHHMLADQYQLELVDVLLQPELAEQFHILLTPTVVLIQPQPERRLVGDLSDTMQLRHGLGL